MSVYVFFPVAILLWICFGGISNATPWQGKHMFVRDALAYSWRHNNCVVSEWIWFARWNTWRIFPGKQMCMERAAGSVMEKFSLVWAKCSIYHTFIRFQCPLHGILTAHSLSCMQFRILHLAVQARCWFRRWPILRHGKSAFFTNLFSSK